MPTQDDQGATVVVIELGGGRLYVKIAEPRPERQRAHDLLRKTIDAWFEAHPQFVIDRAQHVVEAGEILAFHVWYHAEERREVKPLPEPADSPASITIEVDDAVLRQMPKERLEAVVDEAVQLWLSQPDQLGTMIVVSARRIAVILDASACRGQVLPVEEVFAVLDATATEALRTWLGSMPTRLHTVQIAESWFQSHLVGRQRGIIAEPRLVRTNMTYDTAMRPGP